MGSFFFLSFTPLPGVEYIIFLGDLTQKKYAKRSEKREIRTILIRLFRSKYVHLGRTLCNEKTRYLKYTVTKKST